MSNRNKRVTTAKDCDEPRTIGSTRSAILALGDCNTLGAGVLAGNSYPERLGRLLGMETKNRGFTMATTREGLFLLEDSFTETVGCLLIQFGLVDSYRTFKYSPYVLYYPDHFFRKQYRSLVKKYKKICRRHGLHECFGDKNVVDEREYEENLKSMIQRAGNIPVFLLETIPHKETRRNKDILRYNGVLTRLAKEYPTCFKVDLYEDFYDRLDTYYQDETHCNAAGYDFITRKLHDLLHHKLRTTSGK